MKRPMAVSTLRKLFVLVLLCTCLAGAQDREWTVMVYFAGSNLEEEAINDFLRLAETGSTAEVSFVVQLDRSEYEDRRYGNWAGTRRGLITKDDTPSEDWGESLGDANMADGATLREFISWAHTTYPAPKNALVIWDHGYGISGMCDDQNAGGAYERLLFPELSQALDDTDLWFDMIGFMICNGGMIELASYVAPYTDAFAASER
jgi:hypothetical protein